MSAIKISQHIGSSCHHESASPAANACHTVPVGVVKRWMGRKSRLVREVCIELKETVIQYYT